MRTLFVMCFVFAIGFSLVGPNSVMALGNEGDRLAVSGVLGLRPVEESSCVAIWVPVPENEGLHGFEWYNNDGSTIFPEVFLKSGKPNTPVDVDDASVVALRVPGVSSGWSVVELGEPVYSKNGGVYIIVRFPVGSEYSSEGLGGGAAIGYCTDGSGCSGWISADGKEWVGLQGDFRFALMPDYGNGVVGGAINKSYSGGDGPEIEKPWITALLPASPNPFNPMTKIQFSMASKGKVEIQIFNIRGQRVRNLVNGTYDRGLHEVYWMGRDERGSRVASGVYFSRMRAGAIVETQRMMLVQ